MDDLNHATTVSMATAGILGVGFLLGDSAVHVLAGGIGWTATAWVMWWCSGVMRDRPREAARAAKVLVMAAPLNVMSAALVLWGAVGWFASF